MLVMVEGRELLPSLVVDDGVRVLNGDILLKRTLTIVASGALVWFLHPTHLLECSWSSWVRSN